MTEKPSFPIVRHLLGIVCGLVIVFGLAAAYIRGFPMAFLPSGYPVWVAKVRMLDGCDLGSIMQFGDSQLEAGLVANGLPLVTTNFSAGGVSPMDGYFLVRRALTCPHYPRHAIISFGVADFLVIQEAFWANLVRYRILGSAEIADIEHTAHNLHDPSFDDFTTFDGFTGRVRNLLYAYHFPPLYFNSLVKGGFFLREKSNRALFTAALALRGQMPYTGVQEAAPAGRNSPPSPGFRPLPTQAAYFERIVSLLQKSGVSIDFVVMPIAQAVAPGLLADNRERDFIAYLQHIEAEHSNFHLSQISAPIWPDRYFVDDVHLNPRGAVLFTAFLRKCLNIEAMDWESGMYARSCKFPSEPEGVDVGLSGPR